jgi:hypothetical protein
LGPPNWARPHIAAAATATSASKATIAVRMAVTPRIPRPVPGQARHLRVFWRGPSSRPAAGRAGRQIGVRYESRRPFQAGLAGPGPSPIYHSRKFMRCGHESPASQPVLSGHKHPKIRALALRAGHVAPANHPLGP